MWTNSVANEKKTHLHFKRLHLNGGRFFDVNNFNGDLAMPVTPSEKKHTLETLSTKSPVQGFPLEPFFEEKIELR